MAIVVMAIVTYVLLAGLHSGLHSRFHPEILGITASKALAVVLMDFLFVKLGCYFLNISVRPPSPCPSPALLTCLRAASARSLTCSRTTATSSLGASLCCVCA